MLVLSRKAEDAIVFPNLGITVKLLRLNRQVARIGIDAPDGVRVLRQELADGSEESVFDATAFDDKIGQSRSELHEVRNRLNTINLGLQYYRQQMDAGMVEEAHVTFLRVLDELEQIERTVGEHADAEDAATAIHAELQSRSIRLLLVEDDPNQRELLAGLLRMRGCEVETAIDGQAALEFLADHPWPDYVLMDMRMPRVDGVTMIRQIRNAQPDRELRIVAISGSSPEEFRAEPAFDTVDQWFAKPLNTERLLQYMASGELDSVAHSA